MTTSKLTDCPPRSVLSALLANRLSPDESARLHEHLAGCRSCRQVLAELGETDFDRAGQPQGADGTSPQPRTEQAATAVFENAPSVASGTAPPGNDPTQVQPKPEPGAQDATVVEAEVLKMLQPAVERGELGRLGNYRVLRVVGQGGMGIVFEAEDLTLGRKVALKCLRPDMAGDSVRRRFLQEARIAASLPHDHIVTIFHVGQEGDVPYLAMEFLEGESVAKRMKREGILTLAEALRITREVAEGLQVAHSRGLIHRDIKPANVWLESGGEGGDFKRVKLLDFGLARPIESDENLTRHGDVVGTPSYMAPEQACGLAVDARSDLFSLGCMLYRMVTGEVPFRGHDTTAILEAIVHREPRHADSLVPSIPRSVAVLLSELLAKDPAARPASAAVVIVRVRAIERGETRRWPVKTLTQTETVSLASGGGSRHRIGWAGWLGMASIAAALVIGLAVQYRHLLGFSPEAGDSAGGATAAATVPPASVGGAGPAGSPLAKVSGAAIAADARPIKVGVLHSLSGPMGANESKVADIVLMAIDEINQAGGLLGRKIEPVVVDGQSRDEAFAAGAEQLITRDRVSVIFGCWTSSSRRSVRPIVEANDNLLFFPMQNEGLEESPNIVYLGACPNQQMLPAIKWSFAFLEKRRYFLVGSDFVFSHAANEIMKDELARLGGQAVGEKYISLDGLGVVEAVTAIVAAKPEIIVNTITGDGNISFFRALRAAGVMPNQVPTISFSLTENSLRYLKGVETEGDYAAWCYFESIESALNRDFLQHCRARFGDDRAITDPMEVSYCGVYLWAKAAAAALTDKPGEVRTALLGHALDAPEGQIRIDRTQYCWRTPRIGRITAEAQFDEVWREPRPIAPVPFPASRSRADWESYLKSLYQGWGDRWHNPAAPASSPASQR